MTILTTAPSEVFSLPAKVQAIGVGYGGFLFATLAPSGTIDHTVSQSLVVLDDDLDETDQGKVLSIWKMTHGLYPLGKLNISVNIKEQIPSYLAVLWHPQCHRICLVIQHHIYFLQIEWSDQSTSNLRDIVTTDCIPGQSSLQLAYLIDITYHR